MILDVTTDSLEVILGAAATTRAMQFYCSYVTIDSSNVTITPTKNFGSTNGTTAVTLVPAPTSGKINQLKFCTIYNCDSVTHVVTIQVNSSSSLRTVYNINLQSGDQIQFTVIDGWIVFNMNGILKTSNATVGGPAVKNSVYSNGSGTGGGTITSGTDYAFYLGKADRNYNFVTIQLNVMTALGATITWAEAAIYKGYPTIASNLTLTRCGSVDISQGTNHGVNATGSKTIVIPIGARTGDSTIGVGDELWFVTGNVTSGTNLVLRATGIADVLGSGIVQTVTGSLRPSTNTSLSFTLSTTVNPIWMVWHGAQTI